MGHGCSIPSPPNAAEKRVGSTLARRGVRGLSEPPASVAGFACIALGSVRWSRGSGRESLRERSWAGGSIAARFPFPSPGPGTDWQRQQERA